jgi:hypothetical protein
LRNPESEAPYFWFSEQEPLGKFHGETVWRLVTDGHWKIIWNRDDRLELYHLDEDINEIRDLAGQPESAVQENRLKKALLTWMDNTGDRLLEEAEKVCK